MEVKPVLLVLIDISGYTRFISHHRTSIVHAEEIITELLEAVIDQAEYPLQLNKLEGDAAFLYTDCAENPQRAAQDVARQVLGFFDAFKTKQQTLIHRAEGGCPCDACQNIHKLQLKAFLHYGQALFKKIRHFEELAGQDVILIHRLLKNNIPADEYIVTTEAFHQLAGNLPGLTPQTHTETHEFIGDVPLHIFYPRLTGLILHHTPPATRPTGIIEGMRIWVAGLWRRVSQHRAFRHLPAATRPRK